MSHIVKALDELASVRNRIGAIGLAIHSTDIDLDEHVAKSLDQLCIDVEAGLRTIEAALESIHAAAVPELSAKAAQREAKDQPAT